MPIRVNCSQCGYVLYDVKQVNLTLHPDLMQSIVAEHNGRCPNCHKKLVLPKDRATAADYIHVEAYLATTVAVFTRK